jgi:hypothetical protein
VMCSLLSELLIQVSSIIANDVLTTKRRQVEVVKGSLGLSNASLSH